MCGIVGLTGLGSKLWIEAMTQSLHHRGPDDSGLFSDDLLSLGHRRLAILDLSEDGRQPMGLGHLQIVFNGEIYNYKDLRQQLSTLGAQFRTQTDTEVLLHGFQRWGVDLFSKLNGMFALGIYDAKAKRLFLARDRSGQKPLYYTVFEGSNGERRLAFASELRALMVCRAIPKALDLRALTSFLSYDYIPGDRSILRGVKKLPGGRFARFDLRSASLTLEPYWTPDYQPVSINLEQASKELRERLARSLERRLQADVPLGVFLSGGLDSSTLVALLKKDLGLKDLATFSIGFNDASFDESEHAALIAERFGTQHHVEYFSEEAMTDLVPRVFEHLDEPFADPSVLPTYMLSELTRKHVTVALGGDGGDELFAGYDPFRAWAIAKWAGALTPGRISRSILERVLSLLPVSEKNMSFEFRLKRLLRGLWKPAALRHSAWLSPFEPSLLRSLLNEGTRARLKETWGAAALEEEALWEQSWESWREAGATASELSRQIHFYFRCYMGEGILTKVDRASMAHSLEVRAPFLDPDLIDWAARLPDEWKFSGQRGKVVLRHLGSELLPASILKRPKKGFGIPVARWLRGPLRAWVEDLLGPESLERVGLFRRKTVRRILDEHMSRRVDRRKELWALAAFVAWHRRFF